MATYTAATFIPQLQPYQPDLNLYSNLIQNKQTQYDSNWQSLNKVYGQYFYADLTRDKNIKKRDYLVDQINFNVGRIAGLDLSLQQNVSQATQVFKPFYEDKNLMKDMAWTKNYNRQIGRAEALQGSSDEKDRAQFWDPGLREMQYRKEEFKESTDDKAMSMQDVLYTPYVNIQNKALELAKQYGNIESVNFSDDGRWVIKKTNGQILEEPLQKLFEANLGNDPQVQAIYKTQSYVNRKDYAYSNAAQFNGDKNAAEMKYLENNYNILKDISKKRYKQLEERSTVYDNKIKNLQKQINAGNKDPRLKAQLEDYLENKKINEDVLVRAKKENELMTDGHSNTATTSNSSTNPYGDIESLRFKVDNGVASLLMQKDLDEAAHIYAYRNSKVDMDANPYAIMSDKHKYNMSEIAARIQGQKEVSILNAQLKENLLKFQFNLQKTLDSDKDKIAAGTHYRDENGDVMPFEAQNQTYVIKGTKGNVTNEQQLNEISRKIVDDQTSKYADPWMRNTLAVIQELKNNKEIDDSQIKQILGKDYTTFVSELNKTGNRYLYTELGADGLEKIKNNYNNFIKNNSQLTTIKERSQGIISSNLKFQDYVNYLRSERKWRADASEAVESELKRLGIGGNAAQFLYEPNTGLIRSEKQFQAILLENSIDPDDVDYDDLVEAGNKIWKKAEVIKKAPVGLEKFYDPGTGLFTEGAQGIMVNPRSSKGRFYYNSVFKDLDKLDFDNFTTRTSFSGYSKGSALASSSKVKSLLNSIRNEMSTGKSSIGNFELAVAPIASGSFDKAAVIIKPSAKWLKKYVSTNKDQNNNLLTSEEYNNILQNGINIITNSSNMKNELYQSAFKDPLTSFVDANNGYEYTDPIDNRYSLKITPNTLGLGDYTIETKYPIWNTETESWDEFSTTDNTITAGNNLSQIRDQQIFEFMPVVKQTNDDLLND